MGVICWVSHHEVISPDGPHYIAFTFYLVNITIGLRVNEMEEKDGANGISYSSDNSIEEISIEPQSYDKEGLEQDANRTAEIMI